ncbi:MAG: hypothetical protein M5R42_15125 [Rhodocyclaceae bacterium]|nr:hypothetical protein [Rhodocyclaceae bacterium]
MQGTINGIGERCGNANLCSIIPDLQLKLGIECIPPQNLANLTNVARAVSDIANMPHNEKAAYVGGDAFAHKGGMHIDAVVKNPISYEHIDPEAVGNSRRMLMSEVAGRSTLLARIKAVDPSIGKDSPRRRRSSTASSNSSTRATSSRPRRAPSNSSCARSSASTSRSSS